MTANQTRLYREQAKKCRDLARSADDLRRRLTDMADECDDRARDIEGLSATRRTEPSELPSSTPKETIEPYTLSIKDASRLLGLGRSTIYRLIGEGQLDTVKIGNRTLIKTASIRNLAELQD